MKEQMTTITITKKLKKQLSQYKLDLEAKDYEEVIKKAIRGELE